MRAWAVIIPNSRSPPQPTRRGFGEDVFFSEGATLFSSRAGVTICVNAWMFLYARWPVTLAFFDTTLPLLYFRQSAQSL